MTKIETLKSLPTSGELQSIAARTLSEMQEMRRELRSLPEAVAERTASSLEPLDKMAQALDQGLDTQRAIMEPLIREATRQMQKQIDGLSHDRVQRSVRMAREQHRKALRAHRAASGWMQEAKGSRAQKAQMQTQISNLTLRLWVATTVAMTLFLALAAMTLGRVL